MFATLAIVFCTASLGSAVAAEADRYLQKRREPMFPAPGQSGVGRRGQSLEWSSEEGSTGAVAATSGMFER